MRCAASVEASQAILVDPGVLAFRTDMTPATASHAPFENRRRWSSIEAGTHRLRAKISILLKRIIDARGLPHVCPHVLVGLSTGDAGEQY